MRKKQNVGHCCETFSHHQRQAPLLEDNDSAGDNDDSENSVWSKEALHSYTPFFNCKLNDIVDCFETRQCLYCSIFLKCCRGWSLVKRLIQTVDICSCAY